MTTRIQDLIRHVSEKAGLENASTRQLLKLFSSSRDRGDEPIPLSTFSYWRTGRTNPSQKGQKEIIAKSLGVPLEALNSYLEGFSSLEEIAPSIHLDDRLIEQAKIDPRAKQAYRDDIVFRLQSLPPEERIEAIAQAVESLGERGSLDGLASLCGMLHRIILRRLPRGFSAPSLPTPLPRQAIGEIFAPSGVEKIAEASGLTPDRLRKIFENKDEAIDENEALSLIAAFGQIKPEESDEELARTIAHRLNREEIYHG